MNFADAGDGIGLRVVGSQRTADYLCGDGDTLAQGQQYVTVSIELTCDPARSENCVIASFDFELAGANGIIYPNAAEEDDSAFDIPPGLKRLATYQPSSAAMIPISSCSFIIFRPYPTPFLSSSQQVWKRLLESVFRSMPLSA